MLGVCLGGNLPVGKRGTLIHFGFAYGNELRAVDAYGAALLAQPLKIIIAAKDIKRAIFFIFSP